MNGGDDAGMAGEASGGDFRAWVRTWRYLFWLLGIAMCIGLFYGIENWRGEAAWEKYRRQMAARGEPIELSAVVPPEADDADNFAMTPFLAARFSFQPGIPQPQSTTGPGPAQEFAPRFDAAAREVKEPKRPGSVRVNSWAAEQTDLIAWYRAFQEATNPPGQNAAMAWRQRYGLNRSGAVPRGPAGSGQSRGADGAESAAKKPGAAADITLREAAPGVLAGLEECRPVLEELRSASQRPRSRFKLDYTAANPSAILLPHLAALKHLSQVLRLRASAELALGQTDQAFNDVMLMLYLSDACREEPVLISHLVRISQFGLAIQPLAEGLAGHQWSEAQLRELQDRLRRPDFCADARRVMLGESLLFGCGTIEYLRRSPGELAQFMDGGPSMGLAQALMRVAPSGWFYLEKLNLCRAFEKGVLSAVDVPGRQIHPSAGVPEDEEAHQRETRSEPRLFLSHRFFAAMFVPTGVGITLRTAYAQTAADLAAIACALERWRLAHGQFPETLDSLAPGFLDPLPHDIINGQPLKYHRTNDGRFVLYSVGWNQTDDGGTVGLGKNGEQVDIKTGDWVWSGR
jgi:hypothetical protein